MLIFFNLIDAKIEGYKEIITLNILGLLRSQNLEDDFPKYLKLLISHYVLT